MRGFHLLRYHPFRASGRQHVSAVVVARRRPPDSLPIYGRICSVGVDVRRAVIYESKTRTRMNGNEPQKAQKNPTFLCLLCNKAATFSFLDKVFRRAHSPPRRGGE